MNPFSYFTWEERRVLHNALQEYAERQQALSVSLSPDAPDAASVHREEAAVAHDLRRKASSAMDPSASAVRVTLKKNPTHD